MTRDSEEEEDDRHEIRGEIIARRLTGTVKKFRVKSGYGFIIRDDTKEDLFFHVAQTALVKSDPEVLAKTLVDGTMVEFDSYIHRNDRNYIRACNVKVLEDNRVKGVSHSSAWQSANSTEHEVNEIIIASKLTGTVKWFGVKAGYGFIIRDDTNEDIFFPHWTVNGCQSLHKGTIVEFDVAIGKDGKSSARSVRAHDGTSNSKNHEVNNIIAHRVTGTVSKVKSGFGFITRDDTQEDIFVLPSEFSYNPAKPEYRPFREGEIVEFDVAIGKNAKPYARNVSGHR